MAKVLQAVRAQIQEAKAKRRAEAEERPKRTGRKRATEEARRQGHAQVLEPQKGHAVERKEYECPYCQEKYIAAFAQETSKSQGIVASSFALEMVSWCVRSPTLAPAVARRSGQRRRLDGYGSNTGSLMGNRARQPSG